MDDLLLKSGPIGIILILLIREVFQFIKSMKKEDEFKITQEMWNDLENKIQSLYDWHNVKNDDGAPIWYIKTSVYTKFESIENFIRNRS